MSNNHWRIVFAILILLSIGFVVMEGIEGGDSQPPQDTTAYHANQSIGDRNNITVITSMKSPFENTKALYAFDRDGDLLYFDDSMGYSDVDPSPEGETTVLYVAREWRSKDECDGEMKCSIQIVERVNLTTDDTTRLFTWITPKHQASNWHDVDRISETEYIVADIYRDRVFVYNTTTREMTWGWNAQTEFAITGGGPYPTDWTHLNDVEVLTDGRIMLSLRNQDQVVFIKPGRGLLKNQTLGAENKHSVLYEQHNPDYIPPSESGPAVVVADSQNNRIVEYQRKGTTWTRTWIWQDARMQWPRDADRLPNGHTLIADSNGNRVFEVNQEGDIVWHVNITNPYDVERLGTGDESRDGPSATAANLSSRTLSDTAPNQASSTDQPEKDNKSIWRSVRLALSRFVPPKVINAIAFVLPSWVNLPELAAVFIAVSVCGIWGFVEMKWRETGSPV